MDATGMQPSRPIIKTGVLCIPAIDGAAMAAVRDILRGSLSQAVVMLESAVASQRNLIAETLRRWCDEEELDLILTVGGTLPAPGPSAQEIVPEATQDVVERLMPGLPETMRAEALAETPLALLDRGVAGIRGRTLLINLPEGETAALFLQSVAEILPAIAAHLQGAASAPRLGAAFAEPYVDPVDEVDVVGEVDVVDAADEADAPPARKGLDPDEFAAYLRRRDTR